jgi:hypothetical protein
MFIALTSRLWTFFWTSEIRFTLSYRPVFTLIKPCLQSFYFVSNLSLQLSYQMYKFVIFPTDPCSIVLSLITPITQSYSVKLTRFKDYHPANIFSLFQTFRSGSGGRDSIIGMATCYGLEGPGIESRWGWNFPHSSRPSLGPTRPPVQWEPGLLPGSTLAGEWLSWPVLLWTQVKVLFWHILNLDRVLQKHFTWRSIS